MLLVQCIELRKVPGDWRMSVYEVLKQKDGVAARTGEWEVVLGRSKPDFVVTAKDESAYWAFEDALRKAKAMQAKYEKTLEKSS